MASLQNCVDWNTNAVALTLAGRKDEAIVTIKKSLKVLETLFNASKQQGMDIHSKPSTSTSHQAQHSPIVSVPILDAQQACANVNSPANLFTFYPRMFRIVDSSNLGISQLLVVLLFNLAVTSHVDAISEEEPQPAHLRKVLELYETAMRVAHTAWCPEDAQTLLSVLIALTNNVGHIHSHLLNFQQTRESLALQMHLLGQATEESPLAMEDYEVFFESVCIYLDGNDLCLAPAA